METEKTIAANGIHINYAETGAGAPLILLHGGTAELHSFQDHLPAYAQHFRVIALDSRGHGKTDNSGGELSYAMMADDLAAFIRALNLKKPLILGYSDGGQIALDLGMRYPDLAAALVLGGTLYVFKERYFDFLRMMGIEGSGVVNFNHMQDFASDWIDYLKESHPRPDNPEYWKTLMQQISVMWWKPLGYTLDDLKKITAPTLIFVGDRDAGIDLEQILEMYQTIPKAELAVLPNADHGGATNYLSGSLVMDFLLRHKDA